MVLSKEPFPRIPVSERIEMLKKRMLDEPLYMSIEQAKFITKAYKEHPDQPIILKRAWALDEAMRGISIDIGERELIVGNRTRESCAGVVFPEGGISWLAREIDMLSTRPQDKFLVRPEDRAYFFEELLPFWQGHTLEDAIDSALDPQIAALEVVGKLNQKDHAQGHIAPDVEVFLKKGPAGLLAEAQAHLVACAPECRDYYEASIIVLSASCHFIARYALLAEQLAETAQDDIGNDYLNVARNCRALAVRPAATFHEAVQSLWFLFVLLELESNASSFSPGRADQYLYPFYQKGIADGSLTPEMAQELLDAMFIKFNQIVYLRNTKSAAFFAGFPIGFNITIGGRHVDGSDATNPLTFAFLQAQAHCRLRQPNLSARLHTNMSDVYLHRVAEVIGLGTGMPQVMGDEAIEQALINAGFSNDDAINFAVVGCVELSTPGKALSFSDSAMFNMVKALELTLNDGVCMQTGHPLGLPLGTLCDFENYEALETAYARQLAYFVERMEEGLRVIESAHQIYLPSPILSSVISDCLERGVDVTAGGAHYNLSGIQLIQVANVSDSLAALKALVYDSDCVSREQLLKNLRENYPDETLRLTMLNRAPKYGNDVEWVDEIGEKWVEFIKGQLEKYTNFRGGRYIIGLYTVSAHVPMGENVAATPDGRKNREPLADGGLSAVYGRDQSGPTALLKSVSRIKSENAGNGTLLNMKFSPDLFKTEEGVAKFCALLRGFVALRINHAQFNVVNRLDLIAAKEHPEKYRHLLVRVAGYTANYVDLAPQLQDEIIARTEYGA